MEFCSHQTDGFSKLRNRIAAIKVMRTNTQGHVELETVREHRMLYRIYLLNIYVGTVLMTDFNDKASHLLSRHFLIGVVIETSRIAYNLSLGWS